LASAGTHKSLRIRNLTTGQEILAPTDQADSIRSVTFSPDA
jgi:hypothetical protein